MAVVLWGMALECEAPAFVMVKITHNAIRLAVAVAAAAAPVVVAAVAVTGMLFWVRHEWVREVLSACCQILLPCKQPISLHESRGY